jgi:hypothetical protein
MTETPAMLAETAKRNDRKKEHKEEKGDRENNMRKRK